MEKNKNKKNQHNLLTDKNIVLVIAFRDFQDYEYFGCRQILEKAGAKIKIASNKQGIAIGSEGKEVKIDVLLKDLNVERFDAIVFIGGHGALSYLDNQESYKIAREAVLQHKILAAICISPMILAKSGVLKKKKATVWSSSLNKMAVNVLRANYVIYQNKEVVSDKNIITGNRPEACPEFAETIISALN